MPCLQIKYASKNSIISFHSHSLTVFPCLYHSFLLKVYLVDFIFTHFGSPPIYDYIKNYYFLFYSLSISRLCMYHYFHFNSLFWWLVYAEFAQFNWIIYICTIRRTLLMSGHCNALHLPLIDEICSHYLTLKLFTHHCAKKNRRWVIKWNVWLNTFHKLVSWFNVQLGCFFLLKKKSNKLRRVDVIELTFDAVVEKFLMFITLTTGLNNKFSNKIKSKTPYFHAHWFVRLVRVCIGCSSNSFSIFISLQKFTTKPLNYCLFENLLSRRIDIPIFSTKSFLFYLVAQWLKIELFTHSHKIRMQIITKQLTTMVKKSQRETNKSIEKQRQCIEEFEEEVEEKEEERKNET